MDLTEKLNQVTELMKSTKQSWVATDPENTDLAIYLHFWRGEGMVAMVQCPLDRDIGLEAGNVGARGFGASTMSITFESYHSTLGKSPITGKDWQPREMQYTFEAVPENRAEGWVTECLTTTIHQRGGGFAMQSLPYTIENNLVTWGESVLMITEDGETTGGGYMHDYLQQAMAAPTIEEILADQSENSQIAALINGLVDDPEARMFHIDMATYTAMQERNLVTAIMFTAEVGSNRERWIEERHGPGALKFPSTEF